jgi:hypothetical protein
MSIPEGPVRALQSLHSRVVFLSLTIDTRLRLLAHQQLSWYPSGIEQNFAIIFTSFHYSRQ